MLEFHGPSWAMISQTLVSPSTNPYLPRQQSVHQDIAVIPDGIRYHFLLSIDKQELLKGQLL